jgi:DNA-directed RNA polymerase I subunit RPA49
MPCEFIPLVYFSHADLKSKDNLNVKLEQLAPEIKSASNTTKFDPKKLAKKRSKQLKLSVSDIDMSYEAVEDDEQPFLVATLNKATNSLAIFNTRSFNLKPECYLNSHQSVVATTTTTTFSEKLDSLTAAFGSTKKRKVMRVKQNNRLDAKTLESAVSAAVDESKRNLTTTTTTTTTSEQLEDKLEQFSVMPTANREAKSKEQVYELNELLGVTPAEFERATLDLSAKFAMASVDVIRKWKEKQLYTEFVLEHLIKYANAKDGHQYKLQKCRQLAFMHFLLSLYRLKSPQLRVKAPLSAAEVPEMVCARMLDAYTCVANSATGHGGSNKTVRSMPRRLKDKLTCHILVLALHIDDFNTCVDTFQHDLKLSIQRLSDFYQALGCYVKSHVTKVNGKSVSSKRAVLSIPLNDLAMNNKIKKAKKNY